MESSKFILFVKEMLPDYFKNKNVLDLASKNINNIFLFENCIYNGNNINNENNVIDMIKLNHLQFHETIDTIVSTDYLQYDEEYKRMLNNMYYMLKPNGLLFFVCSSIGKQTDTNTKQNIANVDLENIFNLNDKFTVWNTYYNLSSNDMYFIGIKKSTEQFEFNLETYNGDNVLNTTDLKYIEFLNDTYKNDYDYPQKILTYYDTTKCILYTISSISIQNVFSFVDENKLKNVNCEKYPFPHTIIDNFFKQSEVENILQSLDNLSINRCDAQFTNLYSNVEYNKYAWEKNYDNYLKNIFIELNSPKFIKYLERITGINGLIKEDTSLRGAGIHKIKNNGFLQLHTDFNTYYHQQHGKLDRRINLLIYMNRDWKEEYNGKLCLCDRNTQTCVKKISPILNRAVIFNTSRDSIHGHPERLNVPDDIYRQSIAVYYYTKNTNGMYDFEGDTEHNTIWYNHIPV